MRARNSDARHHGTGVGGELNSKQRARKLVMVEKGVGGWRGVTRWGEKGGGSAPTTRRRRERDRSNICVCRFFFSLAIMVNLYERQKCHWIDHSHS